MIIGITGTNGAGKDTAASFLVKGGFSRYSLSDILRQECDARKLPKDRDTLILLGNKLRKEHGSHVLARMILERMQQNEDDLAVIVSIRNESEVKFLKNHPEFKLIAIDAPINERFERAKERATEQDQITFEKFKLQEQREMQGEDEHTQQLSNVINMADEFITNDGSEEEFYMKIAKLI